MPRIILIISFFITIAFSQDYLIKNYNIGDGITQSTVSAICQDSSGFIWFGTNKGLSKFDGKNFKNFTKPEKLFSHRIIQILSLPDKELLILNSANKLWKYDGNSFTEYLIKIDGKPNNIVLNNEGVLLIGTAASGVFVLETDTVKNFTTENGLHSNDVSQLIKNKNGEILCLTKQGVSKYSDGSFIKMFDKQELNFSGIIKKSDGTFWASEFGNGFSKLIDNSWKQFGGVKNLRKSILVEDQNKSIWVAAAWGLYQLIENDFGELYCIHRVHSYNTLSVFVDKNNNIWCGTEGRGVYKLTKNKFANLNVRNNGFPSFYGKALLKDNEDNVWLGAFGYGIIKANSYGSTHYTLNNNIPHFFVHCGTNYINKSILFGTGNGLTLFQNGKFSDFNQKGLGSAIITNICYTSSGELYLSTYKDGIYKYTNNSWRKLNQDKILITNTIYEDPAGKIWFGTNKGLLHLEGESIKKFNLNKNFLPENVTSILSDSLNTIWIGTDNGLFTAKNDSIINSFSKMDGLVSDNIKALVFYNKNLIIGTDDGLGIYNNGKFQFLNTSDGLSTNHIHGPKIVISNNKIWMGTNDGMTIFLVGDYFKNTNNYNIELKSVLTSEETETINLNDFKNYDIQFRAGLDFINLNFSLINYTEDLFRYRYKLIKNGITSEWKYIDDPNIKIDDCSYGDYQIKFEAMSFGDNWQNVDQFKFIILPHFYQTATFWILFISIILSIFSGYYIYNKKMKEKKKYKTSSLAKAKIQELGIEIESLISDQQKFKDPTISLQKLSVNLGVSKEHISQVINTKFKCNFNEFVNSQRVNEAKKMLDKNGELNLQIIQIAYEVGFNSKSSFNNAFKKFTGKTPTEYKKSVHSDKIGIE